MKKNNYMFSLSIIGLLYFVFGFVTWLNSLLIPFLKTACELPDSQAYWVTFAFYISYFVMSIVVVVLVSAFSACSLTLLATSSETSVITL